VKDFKHYLDLWNELHQTHTKLGSEKRNSLMADHCEEMILKAKSAYYGNTGETIMDDLTYDWYEEALKLLRPTSLILVAVGSDE